MTDVVETLKRASEWESDGSYAYSQVLLDAITEIERLRAELSAIRQVSGAVSVEYFNYADFKRDLRNSPKSEGEAT
jgi:hypothetical protein